MVSVIVSPSQVKDESISPSSVILSEAKNLILYYLNGVARRDAVPLYKISRQGVKEGRQSLLKTISPFPQGRGQGDRSSI